MSDCSFLQHIFEYPPKWYTCSTVWLLHGWCCIKLLPSACAVYTIQPCTTSCYFMQSHTHRMHVCLAVTFHLHFWQNDQDYFFTCYRSNNRYQNKSTERVTPEKEILPPLLLGLEPVTIWSQVLCNHWAIPLPAIPSMRRENGVCKIKWNHFPLPSFTFNVNDGAAFLLLTFICHSCFCFVIYSFPFSCMLQDSMLSYQKLQQKKD